MSTSKKPYRISKEVREQIIRRIRDEGVPVTAAAEEHGVSTQAIYYWLTKGASGNPSWREVAKLKKEVAGRFHAPVLKTGVPACAG